MARSSYEVGRAFKDILLHSSASSSASFSASAPNAVPCDVFINHRGPDVKYTLGKDIYNILFRMGLRVFLDTEILQLGDVIPIELEFAMQSAKLHVAIFSERYAESPWCLNELTFMLKTGAPIIPVFYGIDPGDLRWVDSKKSKYCKAFDHYKTKERYSPVKLTEWKAALHDISLHSGCVLNLGDGKERLLKGIVNSVLKLMKKVPLHIGKHPVGLEAAVQHLERTTLDSLGRQHQNVQIVGIVGVGGSGKTTLAKELYNKKCSTMDKSSFLFEVRESKNVLHSLQKKLLADLRLGNIPCEHTLEGKKILASRLRSLRVLMVLDDVDHVDQLEALLPTKENLGSGSLIIVTSRQQAVLTSWGISSIYQMKEMDQHNARQLFCWHAFLQPEPFKEFEDLVENFLKVCNGLPLRLKVLGAQLYGKGTGYWESELKKITKLPDNILHRLNANYDALEVDEQNMFLDIACFLVGEKISLATAVWDGCGWNGEYCFENLVNKCLVELDGQNRIRMHDHFRELGREIAVQHSPYRLWLPGQITDIQRHAEESMLVRGIMAATTQFAACSAHDEFPKCSSHFQPPFEKCMELMEGSSRGFSLLVVTGNDFTQEFSQLASELLWLRWFDFKHANLPSWLSLKTLRVLELYGATSLKGLWEEDAHPPLQLRELIVTATRGSSVERLPRSLSQLKHLTKIALIGYLEDEFGITTLPEEFCDLQSLEHLELRYWKALSSIPTRFGQLTNLLHVDLCFCQELGVLPDSFKQLKRLLYLDLSGCRNLSVKSDILEDMLKLQKLCFSKCRKLFELPLQITNQVSLRELNVQDTNLRNIPITIGHLSNLETLRIGSSQLTSLPDSLGCLSSLTSLYITDCCSLDCLPDSLGRLNYLQKLTLDNLPELTSLPEGLWQLSNLQTLEISGCPISRFDFWE
ncbi:hypothetical protein SUGI_0839800 [Cryptomeria japonica]|nr:hypothetical protein SUGI_0839800 [Cryptomeria japonica]